MARLGEGVARLSRGGLLARLGEGVARLSRGDCWLGWGRGSLGSVGGTVGSAGGARLARLGEGVGWLGRAGPLLCVPHSHDTPGGIAFFMATFAPLGRFVFLSSVPCTNMARMMPDKRILSINGASGKPVLSGPRSAGDRLL